MINFQLAAASGTKFEGDVYEVVLPTKAGGVSIFEDHMPMISAVQGGVVSIRQKQSDHDGDMKHFAVSGGILQVDGKTLKFLSDEITASEDISEKEAEAAHAHAQQLISGAGDRAALHEAHRALAHSTAQLHIARLKRRHHS